MKFTTIAVVVHRVIHNPTVREVGKVVRRHVEDGVVQEVIEFVLRLVRGSTKAKAEEKR